MRSSLYESLHEIVGDEEAEALLAQFPNRDVDEPITREAADVGMAELRAEMAELRVDMAELRAEVRADIAALDARMSAFEARMADRFRAQTTMMVTVVAIGSAVTSALAALIG